MDKLFENKWAIRVISLILAISLYLFVTVETDRTDNESRLGTGTSNEVQVLEDVPLEIKIDADNYVVSGVPEHVTVSLEGKPSTLAPTARQRNFTVFVDLTEFEEGEHTVEIEYENIPNDLTVYIEPKTIDVNIEKRASKDFAVSVDFVNSDNLPTGYEIGEPEITPEVVTIISSESIIEQIAMVKIFIDVTDLKESIRNREVPVSVYDIQGNDLNVLVEPESVTVSVPVDRPSKTVPLTVETKGDLPEEFEMDRLEAPEEIEVFGKREILSEITEVSTEEIDLSKIEKSDTYEVNLELPDDVVANDETIEVIIELNESKVFKDIPIDTDGPEDNITFVNPSDPKIDITATGSDTLMKNVSKQDIRSSIDVTGLNEGEHQVKINVDGPDNVTFEPELNDATIQIE